MNALPLLPAAYRYKPAELFATAQARGYSLFPLHFGSKNPTGLVASFARDASSDPAVWESWWSAFHCNFGLVAGPSGLIIVDPDHGEIGAAAWRTLCAEHGDSADNYPPQHKTPSGYHILFQAPADVRLSQNKLCSDVDVRVHNGFVVAPGSFFAGDGEKPVGWYSVVNDAAPYPAPEWLVARMLKRSANAMPRDRGVDTPATFEEAASAIQWLVDHGEHNERDFWLKIGMACKVEYGDDGFDLWMIATWADCQDAQESRWNGFASEYRAGHVTMRSIFGKARQLGWRRPVSVMFSDVTSGKSIHKTPINSHIPPPANARGGLVGGEAAIVECGATILAGFLAGQTGRAHPDAPQLPEAMAGHDLYGPLNDAIGQVCAMAELQRARLLHTSVDDVLGVLAVAHGETFARVVAFIRGRGCVLPEWPLAVATRQFESKVRRALRVGVGYREGGRPGTPDPANADNVAVFLGLIGAEVRFNDFAKRIEIRWRDGEWSTFGDAELNRLRAIASQEEHAFRPAKEFFRDMVADLARQSIYDPVLDYIDGLIWDGRPRLDSWLAYACHVHLDNRGYHKAVGRSIIGGMIKRARHPGAKHDETAIFIGTKQGEGKSSLCRILAHDPEWFTASLKFDASPQNLIPQMAGKWVAELAELDAMARREVSAVKAFLTTERDHFTAKYAAFATEQPRRLVFIGTSNESTPLRDETGNRRFLPVRITQPINLAWLRANVDQLIAEAAAEEAQGETFAIPPDVWDAAADQQENARARSPLEDLYERWLGVTLAAGVPGVFITSTSLSDAQRMAGESRQVRGALLEKMGFVSGRPYIGGRQIRAWMRPVTTAVDDYVELFPVPPTISGAPVEMRQKIPKK